MGDFKRFELVKGMDRLVSVAQFSPANLIKSKFEKLGGQAVLGAPVADAAPAAGNTGYYQHFQNGWSIFWSQSTGAFEVHGAIRNKWAQLGWERGFLGYPLTDETGTPDGVGRYNHFQHGSIYWTPGTGAFEVHGAIRDKWAQLGWERSYLGYPLTDETTAPDGIGRYNNFQGGVIYWTPAGGAVELQNTRSWDSGPITFKDGTALGGYCRLVMNRNGDWTFSGHMHDSGFDTYAFGIAAAALTPSGIGYTLQIAGRAEGTSAGLPFGTPNRNFDWTTSGNNPSIRDNWMQAAQAQFKVRVVAQDKLAGGLSDVVQDALKDLAKQGIEMGVKALIALLVG